MMKDFINTKTVAILFARRDSIYKNLPDCDVYDIDRDALTFEGKMPVIAHPPCRTWGHLKAFSNAPESEHKFAIWAIEQVRKWGGVLEHPKGSTLFRECKCGLPGGLPDEYGGILIQVDQFHWDHKARKRTLLYIVGTYDLPPFPRRKGKPTHVIDRPGKNRKKTRPNCGKLPWCNKKEREATPLKFAKWLIEIAQNTQNYENA
jgi:hypothetical protein